MAVFAVSPALAQEAPVASAAPEPQAAAAAEVAVQAPVASQAQAAPAAEAVPVSSPAAPAVVLPTVPKLKIAWDCGECKHNDKVVALIEEAYAEEARKNAFAVSETDVAEVAIIDIRQRPPGARVMLGIMAGKDRLGLRINYLGQEYKVSDYSANAVLGLNHLSASVGKQAYAQLAAKPAQ